MFQYQNLILNNEQYKSICNQSVSCNSFLFESNDEIFLQNFSYGFSQYLFCSCLANKPCNECVNCLKISKLALADLYIYPKNSGNKTILVDDVKNLIDNINLTPIETDKKVFIFNNFSSATPQAQNKLLKILEEPPKNAYIILNVTNINKVLPTIISRCKKITLKKLTNDELSELLPKDKVILEDKEIILNIADGNLTKVINYYSNPEFLQVYKDVIFTLSNLKDSKQLLRYSIKFNKSKTTFNYFLEILENIFYDVLLIRLNKQNLVKNRHIMPQLQNYASMLDSDSLYKLIKKINEIEKQIDFNCNFVPLVDNLLLYFLEVKFLCNKKYQ